MAVVYPKEGRSKHLNLIRSNGGSFEMRLFKNNLTPDLDTVVGDFTECDFSGYLAIGLSWGAVTINGDDNAEMVALVASFTHDGGATSNNVYGWYLVGGVGGTEYLAFCERFVDAPRSMAGATDVINVTPAQTQGDCP